MREWLMLVFFLALAAPAAAQTTLAKETAHSVSLTWSESSPSDAAAGYNVYREQKGDAQFQKINSVEITTTNWTDSQIANSTTYLYYVTALDSQSNESGPSNTITLDIPWVPYPASISLQGTT